MKPHSCWHLLSTDCRSCQAPDTFKMHSSHAAQRRLQPRAITHPRRRSASVSRTLVPEPALLWQPCKQAALLARCQPSCQPLHLSRSCTSAPPCYVPACAVQGDLLRQHRSGCVLRAGLSVWSRGCSQSVHALQGRPAGCGTFCDALGQAASWCPCQAALTRLQWPPLWAACASSTKLNARHSSDQGRTSPLCVCYRTGLLAVGLSAALRGKWLPGAPIRRS